MTLASARVDDGQSLYGDLRCISVLKNHVAVWVNEVLAVVATEQSSWDWVAGVRKCVPNVKLFDELGHTAWAGERFVPAVSFPCGASQDVGVPFECFQHERGV